MGFARALAVDALWDGEMIGVIVDGVPVLLVQCDDRVRAFADRCAHQRVRLSEGRLDGCVLTCRAHEWQYDARTGSGVNPADARLRMYPIRIEDGHILVDVEGA